VIVGIDLGTTNSLIGAVDVGFPVLLADSDGERLTPSAVFYREGQAPVVGREALRLRGLAEGELVRSVKRLMGLRAGEVDFEFPGSIVGASGHPVRLVAGGAERSPEEVSAEILKKLKADAESALETEVRDAVITVPAYFNDAQRNATKRAGERAGLNVVRLVSEPTAAALAYGLDRLDEDAKVAVYDLGGGTFDISILNLRGGVFDVVSTNGDTHLGGDDLDAAIMRILAEKLGIKMGDDLLPVAESAKRCLSRDAETEVSLPFFRDGESYSCLLTRPEIEQVCLPILERTRSLALRSLHDARIRPADLDVVILVGGATRMPLVRRLVSEFFETEPNTTQHPDEAVALGATIQAGVLDGSIGDVTLLDVTPLSLGIETFGGLMNVIIPRNSTIPTKAGEMFTNAVGEQTEMRLTVLQGEREMARDNWKLGEVIVPFTPAPKGQARVGVQFEIDADGILQVLARDIATGGDTVLKIASAIDVEDTKVEEMVASSVDHAFDDMSERVFTEAKIKAEEILPAIEVALLKLGDTVSSEERQDIERLQSETREAMEARDANRLKRLIEKLDDATEPLAVKLLEMQQ